MESKDGDIEFLSQPLMTGEGLVNPACLNELGNAIENMPKTYNRLSGDPEFTKKRWMFVHDITGYLAMWAIRQSPYVYPERLEEVVKYLDACLTRHMNRMKDEDKVDSEKMMCLTLCEVNKLLYDILYEQGFEAFDSWNKCKKGDTPDIAYTSRCDFGKKSDPDYEFIDLDALLRNVCTSLRDDYRKDDAFDEKFKKEHGSLPWEK